MNALTERFVGTDTYLCPPDLAEAVHVAATLGRPLLVKGEPGTGKTCLAEAVAEHAGLPLLRWSIKSTTKAKDGLYVYDTVARLNDARFGDRDIRDIRQYIRFGPLGEALRADQPVVLLIDEIDKADLEFPNDLLHELDRMRFTVDETGDEISAKYRPLVFLTSNNEKELPDAFLRRCVFHYIAFPDEGMLKSIVQVHHPGVAQALLDAAVKRFEDLRKVGELRKRPSTSELVDWVAALLADGLTPEALEGRLPYLGALLKHEQDIERVERGGQRQRRSPW